MGKTVILNDDNFNQFKSNSLALVDIWAPWCGPCKILGPIIDEISSDYDEKLSVGKLDVDENNATANLLGIRNIPTLLLYKDGELVEKIIGLSTKAKITSTIDKYL